MEVWCVFVSQSGTASKAPWPGIGGAEDDADVPSPMGTCHTEQPGRH